MSQKGKTDIKVCSHYKTLLIKNIYIYIKRINKSMVIVGNLNTPFSKTDRMPEKITGKDIEDQNIINYLDLIGIYRTLYPTIQSIHIAYGKLTSINHTLGQKQDSQESLNFKEYIL